jgi:hypothetical protein
LRNSLIQYNLSKTEYRLSGNLFFMENFTRANNIESRKYKF